MPPRPATSGCCGPGIGHRFGAGAGLGPEPTATTRTPDAGRQPQHPPRPDAAHHLDQTGSSPEGVGRTIGDCSGPGMSAGRDRRWCQQQRVTTAGTRRGRTAHHARFRAFCSAQNATRHVQIRARSVRSARPRRASPSRPAGRRCQCAVRIILTRRAARIRSWPAQPATTARVGAFRPRLGRAGRASDRRIALVDKGFTRMPLASM